MSTVVVILIDVSVILLSISIGVLIRWVDRLDRRVHRMSEYERLRDFLPH